MARTPPPRGSRPYIHAATSHPHPLASPSAGPCVVAIDDADVRAAQLDVPRAIVIGRHDPVVDVDERPRGRGALRERSRRSRRARRRRIRPASPTIRSPGRGRRGAPRPRAAASRRSRASCARPKRGRRGPSPSGGKRVPRLDQAVMGTAQIGAQHGGRSPPDPPRSPRRAPPRSGTSRRPRRGRRPRPSPRRPSALRARCVTTSARVQPGSRDGAAACSSVRSSTARRT